MAAAAPAAQPGPGTKAGKTAITEVATDHMRIRYLNQLTVPPAGSIALVLEIAPRPGMHVYAPGAADYQVITFSLAEQPGIRPRPLSYPPSEIYHFEPLNERIPVYQKPFELRLGADIERTAGIADMRKNRKISGHLEYQACDDKVCFAPVVVPLSWTVLE
jgi:DsbC/DsbD-like thiol-disulfide interchange protein